MAGGHAAAVHAAPMRSVPTRAPMRGPAVRAARVAPRVSTVRVTRPVNRAVARPAVARTAAARRAPERFRRDRFGRLHREFIYPFFGAGYPGYLDYYPYDFGYDDNFGYDQNSYASAPPETELAPDDQQYATAPSASTALPADNTIANSAQLILARKDGQIVTPSAFTISGDRVVYISQQGARLSFPVAELDKDTTRQMNAAIGNNISIPD